MNELQTILFPLDFSDAALAMVAYVREMAHRFGARITVLHAFHLVPDYVMALDLAAGSASRPAPIPYTPDFQRIRDERQARLESLASDQFATVSHIARIEDGDPAAVIEWVTHRESMDLIMMPTRGLGKFRRLLLGSVTAKVLHDVSCPVLTSAHLADRTGFSTSGYRSIVCAVEPGPEADRVLQSAAFVARSYSAKLCAVHVESDPPAVVMAEGARFGADVKVRVVDKDTGADISGVIRNTAIEEKADLLVVGRGRDQGTLSCMWSQLYSIIRESPCPVLSV